MPPPETIPAMQTEHEATPHRKRDVPDSTTPVSSPADSHHSRSRSSSSGSDSGSTSSSQRDHAVAAKSAHPILPQHSDGPLYLTTHAEEESTDLSSPRHTTSTVRVSEGETVRLSTTSDVPRVVKDGPMEEAVTRPILQLPTGTDGAAMESIPLMATEPADSQRSTAIFLAPATHTDSAASHPIPLPLSVAPPASPHARPPLPPPPASSASARVVTFAPDALPSHRSSFPHGEPQATGSPSVATLDPPGPTAVDSPASPSSPYHSSTRGVPPPGAEGSSASSSRMVEQGSMGGGLAAAVPSQNSISSTGGASVSSPLVGNAAVPTTAAAVAKDNLDDPAAEPLTLPGVMSNVVVTYPVALPAGTTEGVGDSAEEGIPQSHATSQASVAAAAAPEEETSSYEYYEEIMEEELEESSYADTSSLEGMQEEGGDLQEEEAPRIDIIEAKHSSSSESSSEDDEDQSRTSSTASSTELKKHKKHKKSRKTREEAGQVQKALLYGHPLRHAPQSPGPAADPFAAEQPPHEKDSSTEDLMDSRSTTPEKLTAEESVKKKKKEKEKGVPAASAAAVAAVRGKKTKANASQPEHRTTTDVKEKAAHDPFNEPPSPATPTKKKKNKKSEYSHSPTAASPTVPHGHTLVVAHEPDMTEDPHATEAQGSVVPLTVPNLDALARREGGDGHTSDEDESRHPFGDESDVSWAPSVSGVPQRQGRDAGQSATVGEEEPLKKKRPGFFSRLKNMFACSSKNMSEDVVAKEGEEPFQRLSIDDERSVSFEVGSESSPRGSRSRHSKREGVSREEEKSHRTTAHSSPAEHGNKHKKKRSGSVNLIRENSSEESDASSAHHQSRRPTNSFPLSSRTNSSDRKRSHHSEVESGGSKDGKAAETPHHLRQHKKSKKKRNKSEAESKKKNKSKKSRSSRKPHRGEQDDNHESEEPPLGLESASTHTTSPKVTLTSHTQRPSKKGGDSSKEQ